MGVFGYNIPSSSTDVPVVRRLLASSSSGSATLALASEGLIEASAVKARRLPLPEARKMPSGDNSIDPEE